jgi:hypothetical protein
MAVLRLAFALGLAWLAGCVPGELFVAGQGEGGSKPAHDGGGHAPDARSGADTGKSSCPTPADCNDPACVAEGYVCTPPAPMGWSIATVDFTGHAPCPPGYGVSQELPTPPTGGPASCGCTCAAGPLPSCTIGNVEYSAGSTTCTSAGHFDANGGLCTAAAEVVEAFVEITAVPLPAGASCVATPSTTLPPTGSTTDAVCVWSGTPSTTGCSGGDVCVATTSARAQCILEEGSTSCAGAYSAAYSVGASLDDTRACTGACTCGQPTAKCTKKTLTLYTAGTCTGATLVLDTDGVCDATGEVASMYNSYQYTATPTVVCASPTETPAPVGSLTLTDPQTLCCLP